MTKLKIMNNVSRTLGKAGLKIKKYSPEILVVAGVAGVVTSTVMACKATTKAGDILEEAKQQVDSVHEVLDNPEYSDRYSEEDSKKDLAIIYLQTGIKFAKLYGPSIALGVASIGCILTSHKILRKRNIALAAAYATVDKGFKEYRGRVVERFGKDMDRELKYNIKAQEIEETVVNEDGTETTIKSVVNAVDPNEYSEFARFYDDGCLGWEKNPEMNLVFLKHQQSYANDLLQRRGYVFLNEVYDMLGIPKTAAGQVVGWAYDENNPDCDNFIDFGIYDLYNTKARDFVNGRERVILLDFNVTGNILGYV